MQINKIELENFKQYKYAEIDFPEGLTGFIGKNGAGKSTIFEAISIAFYGSLATNKINKDKIRNDKSSDKEPVIIELEFEDRGFKYKVKREYRGKNLVAKGALFKEENFVAEGTSEVDKEIKKIIKIDYSNFKNSYFAHQKDISSLLALGKTERQRSLRQMLGLEKIDKFEAKVKDFIKEKEAELSGSEKELLPETELEELKNSIKEKKEESARLEKLFEQKDKLTVEKEKEYNKIRRELSELEKRKEKFDTLNKGIEISKTKLGNIRENREEAEIDLKKLNEAKTECEKLTPEKEKFERVTARISELQELKNKHTEKVNLEKNLSEKRGTLLIKQKRVKEQKAEINKFSDIENKTAELNKLKEAHRETLKTEMRLLTNLNESLGSIKNELKEKKRRLEEIKKIGRDSECPECERPLGDHYDKLTGKYNLEIEKLKAKNDEKKKEKENVDLRIKEKEKKIDDLNALLSEQEKRGEARKNLNNTILELSAEIENLNKDSGKIEKDLSGFEEIAFDENDLSAAQDEHKKLKPAHDECLRLENKAKEIPGKEKRIAELKVGEKSQTEEIEDLKQQLNKLNFDAGKHGEVKIARDEKENELNEIREARNEIKNERTNLSGLLRLDEERLKADEKRKERIKALRDDVELYEKLKITAAAFKEKVTSRELPEISRSASQLFKEITKGRYYDLRIKEDFNFTVMRDDMETDLNTLSGGEKDLASLCLRIAISKRISSLAGRSAMGFLALDEVFGSQDEGRREELLNAFNRISKEFKQIFVVSHNRDVQEEFPNRLMIRKEGDYSVAELAAG